MQVDFWEKHVHEREKYFELFRCGFNAQGGGMSAQEGGGYLAQNMNSRQIPSSL